MTKKNCQQSESYKIKKQIVIFDETKLLSY